MTLRTSLALLLLLVLTFPAAPQEPVRNQGPSLDALRAAAEAGNAEALVQLGLRYRGWFSKQVNHKPTPEQSRVFLADI